MSNDDRVALTALRFASASSAGAACMAFDSDQESQFHNFGDEASDQYMEASMEQLCIPLPTWAYRAGARETIYMNPKDTKVASKWLIYAYNSDIDN